MLCMLWFAVTCIETLERVGRCYPEYVKCNLFWIVVNSLITCTSTSFKKSRVFVIPSPPVPPTGRMFFPVSNFISYVSPTMFVSLFCRPQTFYHLSFVLCNHSQDILICLCLACHLLFLYLGPLGC